MTGTIVNFEEEVDRRTAEGLYTVPRGTPGPGELVRWRMKWEVDGDQVVVDDCKPCWCQVLPDRRGVVGLTESPCETDLWDILFVINSNGSTRFTLGNVQYILGRWLRVAYSFFEPAQKDPKRLIGVACGFDNIDPSDPSEPPQMRRLEIDPYDATIVHVTQVR